VVERISVRKEYDHPTLGYLSFDQLMLSANEKPPQRLFVLVPTPGTATMEILQNIASQPAENPQ
jgi:hypothetical protein